MLTLIESNIQNKLQRENCLGAETGNFFCLELINVHQKQSQQKNCCNNPMVEYYYTLSQYFEL